MGAAVVGREPMAAPAQGRPGAPRRRRARRLPPARHRRRVQRRPPALRQGPVRPRHRTARRQATKVRPKPAVAPRRAQLGLSGSRRSATARQECGKSAWHGGGRWLCPVLFPILLRHIRTMKRLFGRALLMLAFLPAAACTPQSGLESGSAQLTQSGFGAIAFSPASQDWSFRWNSSSPENAATLAVSDCQDASCQIVLEFGPKQCGTLALGPSGYGVGVGRSTAAAEKTALAQCSVGGQQCRVAPAECNS